MVQPPGRAAAAAASARQSGPSRGRRRYQLGSALRKRPSHHRCRRINRWPGRSGPAAGSRPPGPGPRSWPGRYRDRSRLRSRRPRCGRRGCHGASPGLGARSVAGPGAGAGAAAAAAAAASSKQKCRQRLGIGIIEGAQCAPAARTGRGVTARARSGHGTLNSVRSPSLAAGRREFGSWGSKSCTDQ